LGPFVVPSEPDPPHPGAGQVDREDQEDVDGDDVPPPDPVGDEGVHLRGGLPEGATRGAAEHYRENDQPDDDRRCWQERRSPHGGRAAGSGDDVSVGALMVHLPSGSVNWPTPYASGPAQVGEAPRQRDPAAEGRGGPTTLSIHGAP